MRVFTRTTTSRLRLIAGASLGAIAMASGSAAFAQETHVPDPADSSSTAANPNESGHADTAKANNVAVTGDVTPAQNEADATAAGQAAANAGADDATQDVVVTGFRRSLETAVAEKKSRDQIVESISAEDIGKLPDASIAESIARLPGLTSQRIEGRSSFISIRGFAPDFSTTLLNGREQTSTGDNRAVEYDQYPAEVVNQVLVYKTPMASIVGQGLSGTVDLRTIRPIEYGKRIISVGARAVDADIGKLNADSKQYGYRLNGTYVDQFADGRVGIAIAASYTDEPYQTQEFNAWGYGQIGTCDSRYSTFGAEATSIDCGGDNPATRYATVKPDYTDAVGKNVIGGSKSYITSTELKRFGITGTLEIKPTDHITTTFDGFYSDFKDDQIKRGIELPLVFQGSPTILEPGYTVEGDTITSGSFGNVEGVVRNDAFQRHAKLYSFGWNTKYEGDDGWSAMLDVSHSRTDRNELVFESYSGTGYRLGNGAADTIGFQTSGNGYSFTHDLDYSDPNLIQLTDPNGWGGDNLQSGYYNNRIVKDRIWQFRAEAGKTFDSAFLSGFKVGMNYTNHNKSLTPDEYLVQLANGAQSTPVPSEYQLDPSNQAYLGLGPIISYDPLALLDGGVLTRISNNANADVRSKAYQISEDLMTLYTQFDIKAAIGASELTGNVGVQAVETSQHSSALFAGAGGALSRATRGADYWDVMPSLNLSLRFPSDFVIRFGAAREVMRPRMDDMRLAAGYGVDLTTRGYPFLSGSAGDPTIRPFRANALDLSFEKYFGTKGYLAAQFFFKGIDTFVVDQNLPGSPYDYSGLPIPTGYQITNPGGAGYISEEGIVNGVLYKPYNTKGGKLYGVELAGTLPLGEIVKPLDGFGLTGGGSYTISRIHQYPGADYSALPGYSRWVVNGTAYFEKWGFSARGSARYRSSFIGEFSGFGANRVQRKAFAETIIDAQIGYDFSGSNGALRGLSIYLQGQNLTNEPFRSHNGDDLTQIIDDQSYGKRFLAGFNLKF